MPRKITRSDRKLTGSRLCRPRKIVPPHKRKNEGISTSSASAKKIKVTVEDQVTEDLEKHYRIIDFLLVFSTIATLVKCVKCDGKVNFHSTKKEGLGFNIKVSCESCKQITNVPSSARINSGIFEVNYRFVFVMRILGLGLDGCEKFCGLMDLSSRFLSTPTYNDYMKKMCSTVKETANRFFLSAIKEEKAATAEEKKTEDADELTVSGDGTWKKRGFSFLFGVTSLIGYFTGKVLDIFVKSSYCHECKTWEHKLNSAEYEEWHEAHVSGGKCLTNHISATGNMAVEAVKTMFQRSVQNGVRYRNYIGDGDSEVNSELVNSKPYGDDFAIVKKECVGHVEKRMGTRLREIKMERKSLSGKGKLTAKIIDKLTVYYGLAIRRHSDSIENMKNAIWATFFHYSSTDENPQHKKCPSDADSWCEWQKAAAANALDSFKHTYSALPVDVLNAIKPIYEDLSKDALLERCVGGFTQNNNESLNQLIWEISPKHSSEASVIVEIAAYVAASVFNEGPFALLTFMQDMGISSGSSAHDWARSTDSIRISRAE
ncbi:uncharacterized protein [Bombus flavifrons]|uniref:uncharacterized protein n=1 Tax=Bombus flavifrons TaxID=103934 RepID=UPI0037037F98